MQYSISVMEKNRNHVRVFLLEQMNYSLSRALQVSVGFLTSFSQLHLSYSYS